MTPQFLFFADLVLLLRLRLLFADRPIGWRGWTLKAVVEIAVLLALFRIGLASGGAMAASVLVSAASLAWEHSGRERNGGQLLLGAVHLLALSVCFSREAGVALHAWVPALGRALPETMALGGWLVALASPAGLKTIFGLLLSANEANLVIRAVLGRLQLRPGGAVAQGIDADEYARGRVIGVLERALIFFFVLNGQLGAVGFTLAAKGLTRFKELEDRGFAEYVLIGTLLSSGLAMLAAALVTWA